MKEKKNRMPPNHNYAELDKKIIFSYRTDRIKQAAELGFDYISECVVKLYRHNKSISKVAAILKLSPYGIQYELKKIGEPVQLPGGFHLGDKRSHVYEDLWNAKNFDSKKYYLGSLCKNNHDWNKTGKSLRASSRSCIRCMTIRNKKRNKTTGRKVVLNEL